jgi:hypothetical protein
MSQTHRGSTYSTPRWVKVFGIIVIVLVLLVVIIIFTGVGGEHGPGRHIPSGDAGGDTPLSIVTGGVPLQRQDRRASGNQ